MTRRTIVVIAVALALSFTLVHYVRRRTMPRAVEVETVVGGSRDRSLRGKARIRARRMERAQ